MLFAFDVPHVNAFAFHDDTRINGFKWLVLNQVVPHVGTVGFDNLFRIVWQKRNVHFSISKTGGAWHESINVTVRLFSLLANSFSIK